MEELVNAFSGQDGYDLHNVGQEIWDEMLAKFYPDRVDESNDVLDQLKNDGVSYNAIKDKIDDFLGKNHLPRDVLSVAGIARIVSNFHHIKAMSLGIKHEMFDLIPDKYK